MKTSISNCFQFDEETSEVWVVVYIHPELKYDYHRANFQEIHACATALVKDSCIESH